MTEKEHKEYICECGHEFDTCYTEYNEREDFSFCPACRSDNFNTIEGNCIGCGGMITANQYFDELSNGLICSSCIDQVQLVLKEAKEEEE